ncbi:hypothetical protein R2325_13950 [Mycobacteroides chelonae]|uniref:hypothetical protein n=1 Tax=Mycobacteroides chelonae TaxID=1774 RepID=UPI002DE8FC7E|nr:hypothetical protein [Mycobacteroides chelonae]MEC4873128.1 hypothetical protein [Mycobacteroides chelonae]
MSVVDSFYLDKRSQLLLRDELRSVPALVEDLLVTLTRQARIQKIGLGKPRRQRPESRIPFHLGASEASDALHNCLSTWVRLVCEQRAIAYREAGDIVTLARWLRRNLVALALTEGAGEAYADIKAAIDECRKQIDLPPEDDIVIDKARVQAANKSVVTLSTIGPIANRIGVLGRGLNRDRLRYLEKTGKVRPCGEDPDTGTQFFRLGDVLHAHNDRTKVKRSGGAS